MPRSWATSRWPSGKRSNKRRAPAMPNGDVDILAGEVDVMQRRAHPQIDGRMLLRKPAQPVYQPFGREIWRRAHREHAGVLAAQQSLGPVGDPVERIAYGRKITSP